MQCFISYTVCKMSKRLKVTLYVILILTVVAVVWLMFWSFKPNSETIEDIQIPVEENTDENTDNSQEIQVQTDTFEEDVMKDLEWFFGNNNGYEDVQWEYWFNNPENE